MTGSFGPPVAGALAAAGPGSPAPPLALGIEARGAGLALPLGLTRRGLAQAWVIALAAHVAIGALALSALSGSAPDPEPPPIRMVFVEPPPPPPAPVGIPGGEAVAAQAPPVVPAQPKEPPKTDAAEPRRLRRADPKVKPKAKPKPRVVEPPPAAAPAEVAAGIPTGSITQQQAGVVGGVDGGVAGGIIGGSGTGPIPAGQVAQPPLLVRRVAPVYPRAARRQGIQGLVLLEAILDRDGQVERDIKVLESIPVLDEEAIAAVRQWRFRPARDDSGAPLRVILEIPIRFTLR